VAERIAEVRRAVGHAGERDRVPHRVHLVGVVLEQQTGERATFVQDEQFDLVVFDSDSWARFKGGGALGE